MKPQKKTSAGVPSKTTAKSTKKNTSRTGEKAAAAKSASAAKAGSAATKAAAREPKASRVRRAAKKPLTVPSILLEPESAPAPGPSGPGQRYALGPTPPSEPTVQTASQLPEAYGTKRLLLAARDPHWLYAHWDFSREQLRDANQQSAAGHLILRIYEGEIADQPLSEIHVHPESRNWFVPVGRGSQRYMAELGCYDRAGRWSTLSTSGATLTPPESISEDADIRFATIPPDVPFEVLLELVKTAVSEHVPLAEALMQLRAQGCTQLPRGENLAGTWTPEQERALREILSMDQVRRVWMGSLEITELIRRQLVAEISSAAAAQFGLPTSPMEALGSLASPLGGVPRQKGFWFNVNAELIIYGATEPDATVAIGGREIKLRPDGTFSFRFALPDGKFELPVTAVSADGDDARGAGLEFSRSTEFRGEVGAHPQDPGLKEPRVANVA